MGGSDGGTGTSTATGEARDVFGAGMIDDDLESVVHEWMSPSGKALLDMSKTSENGDASLYFSRALSGEGTSRDGEQNEDDTEGTFFIWWRERTAAAKTRFTVPPMRTYPAVAVSVGMVQKALVQRKAGHLR